MNQSFIESKREVQKKNMVLLKGYKYVLKCDFFIDIRFCYCKGDLGLDFGIIRFVGFRFRFDQLFVLFKFVD